MSEFLSTHWVTIIAILGTIGTIVGPGLTAYLKNNKHELLAAMLQAAVKGVEVAGDQVTKDSIKDQATAAGVQNELHAVVQTVTATMTPPPPPVTHPD